MLRPYSLASHLRKTVIAAFAVFSLVVPIVAPHAAYAQYLPEPGTPLPAATGLPTHFEPRGCASGQGAVNPVQRLRSFCLRLNDSDPSAADANAMPCANTYTEWLANPNLNFWVEDPDVTALGKGGERSRQFLLWALTRQSIDDHPVVLNVWKLSQNVALFLVLLVVIVMGMGIIVGQRGIGFMGSSFSLNVEITPLIMKVAILLLYIVFSARIVLLIIQFSDVIMEFFIRTLGVRDLFNIYFIDSAGSINSLAEGLAKSEQAYREFIGCTNWNIDNVEMVRTSKSLVKFTNMTYYFLGGMLLLRKIVLWFLLVVSPFLAILAPFIFIRNIGWIWIGVFFQWVFYGPLMALFLGALANIWNTSPVHIPYIFDFSRVHKASEMVYPTSINILYGGPAQKLGLFNTSNYVDTFVEYIISLMMLWTVLILPWWLLRIFRDYCCDGIYAMRNVLMAMYDNMRAGSPPPPPGRAPTPAPTGTGTTALEFNQPTIKPIETRIRLETVQEIKQAQTQQIVQSIGMEARSLRDVARFETDTVTKSAVTQTLNQMQNPFKAETPSERQRLMNVRNEVQARAREGDQLAQRLAAVTAKSSSQERVAREQILASMPKVAVPATVAEVTTSQVKVALPKAKKQVVIQQALTNIVQNQQIMQQVSQDTGVPVAQASHILQTVTRLSALDTTTDNAVTRTAQEVGVEEAKVKQVIARTATLVRERSDVVATVARQEGVDKETVSEAVQKELRGAVGVTTAATNQIVQRVFTQVALDPQAVTVVAQQAGVAPEVARKILAQLGQAQDYDVAGKEVVMKAADTAGVPQEQVKKVLQTTAVVVDGQLVQNVATAQKVDAATVKEVAQENIAALSKVDKEIEDYVPQTQKVSIEDYEEVKGMWLEHYEHGEIPVTENVQSREEWVQQDAVRISNILNKLMSADQAMQEQGLVEVGYILPIFMVNNLSGEELLVYLKAKIQAAKEVARSLDKEREIRAKVKSEEELVEIEVPEKETEKKVEGLKMELEEEKESVGEVDGEPRGEGESSPPVDANAIGTVPEPAGEAPAPHSGPEADFNADTPQEEQPNDDLRRIQDVLKEATN